MAVLASDGREAWDDSGVPAATPLGPARVEGPKLPEELLPLDGEALGDGDPVEGVVWDGAGLPPRVKELEIRESRLSGVRLTGVELDRFDLIDVVIHGCELSGAVFEAARWERVTFMGCRMSGLVATGLRARHVRFAECQLDGAWLRSASLEQCELADCDLTDADLYGARLVATRFLRCRLGGAELSEVDADEVALHGSELAGAKGLASLQRLVIARDQIIDLAVPLLTARHIRVDDDYLSTEDRPT